MSEIRRRSFLTLLGTLPVVSDWMRILGSTSAKSTVQKVARDEAWEAKFLAVETLRLINTAEKWHFLATNAHISLEDLHQSESYKKLVENSGKSRFKRVVSKFPSDGRVELPGYDIFVQPNADRSRYLARVLMNGPKYTFAFASDEAGEIYEGVPVGHPSPAAANEGIDSLISDRHPMGWRPKTEAKSGALFAAISMPRILDLLSTLLQGGDKDGCHCCGCTYPCSCNPFCSCSSICPDCSGGTYCCFNCGCSSCGCTWCRKTSCDAFCATDCVGGCDICQGDFWSCQCGA